MATGLVAPFPYFGGKARIAPIVWQALGQPRHYFEPFFGSGAVLLARPDYDPQKHIETIGDADGYVANAWRAIRSDPDQVAYWCDWPVNHVDLAARRRRLLAARQDLVRKLVEDEEWYDARLAGYWVWGMSIWIGGGFTDESQSDTLGQRPHLTDTGTGVAKMSLRAAADTNTGRRPDLADGGKGVAKVSLRPVTDVGLGRRPHLTGTGSGVHRLSLRQEAHGESTAWGRTPAIYDWMRRLAERLRYVRVVCGDWTRLCGGNWQARLGSAGFFFDPPYGVRDRDHIYDQDSRDVARAVAEWSLERGKDKAYRIVIAGYDEHEWLLDHGWTVYHWKATGGYSSFGPGKQGAKNRFREALYFSPYCLSLPQLFEADAELEAGQTADAEAD